MTAEGPTDRPPPPPPPDPPPDYSAVNEPITIDLRRVGDIEPIHRDQTPGAAEQRGNQEAVSGTGEGARAQPPDYSSVNEPISGQRGELEAAAGAEATARWESNEDRILQDNAAFFDSEAARYRELGDDFAATKSQEQADQARSFIGDNGNPTGTDAAGTANAGQGGEQDPAAAYPEAPAESDAMARWEASEDRKLQDNAAFFDSEAARYQELHDGVAATKSQEQADMARSFIADSGNGNTPDTAANTADTKLEPDDIATEPDAEKNWMDEASAADLENFRADAYQRLNDNLAIEHGSRLGGAINDQAEAKADAAASEVKRAQADIDEATKRINTLRYPR